MFERPQFARFLLAADFDPDKALKNFTSYLDWRKVQSIDKLLVNNAPLQLIGIRIYLVG